ncbi:hypothetical protein CBM2587_P20021 [Cupriavidus taiwanensis]|uniref:Uncharacterized protein n=1 Tax=Cupriavidus taiwanensis TaxID=164546 RepID=A0A375CJQ7_9BURK|nr:hypothetical protein CBM2587_P20021 [Cupriavidus taiwanensis]
MCCKIQSYIPLRRPRLGQRGAAQWLDTTMWRRVSAMPVLALPENGREVVTPVNCGFRQR